jgi:hypothetical protein
MLPLGGRNLQLIYPDSFVFWSETFWPTDILRQQCFAETIWSTINNQLVNTSLYSTECVGQPNVCQSIEVNQP